MASERGLRGWNPRAEGAVGGFDAMVGLNDVEWVGEGSVATFDRNGFWRQFDGRTGDLEVESILGQGVIPQAVASAPEGRRIAVGLPDGGLLQFDDGRRSAWFVEAHEGAARAVAWSPDGRRLVSGSSDGSMRVWDESSTRRVLELRPTG